MACSVGQPVQHCINDTGNVEYQCRAADAIRPTLSSQIVVLVYCRHPYRHWLFSNNVGSSDVLITDTNSFCSSHSGDITFTDTGFFLQCPMLSSFCLTLILNLNEKIKFEFMWFQIQITWFKYYYPQISFIQLQESIEWEN
jgi:hypothetical protein